MKEFKEWRYISGKKIFNLGSNFGVYFEIGVSFQLKLTYLFIEKIKLNYGVKKIERKYRK